MDILAWSFTDWFTVVIISAILLNVLVFGITFLVENREALRYNAEMKKAEREARPKPRKDPPFKDISDWAVESRFEATRLEGE